MEPTEDEKRTAEINGLIDRVPMKPPATTPEQRATAFARLVKQEEVAITCRGCNEPVKAHINAVCRTCFVEKNVDARPVPALATPPAKGIEPFCGFCGRKHSEIQAPESITAGKSAMICSTCAATAASCMGAANGAEARRMLASASLQAEAVSQCVEMMKRTGIVGKEVADSPPAERQSVAELALTLSQAAELLARIARGDK